MSKNLIIGQSGGPTAVINSSLAGAMTMHSVVTKSAAFTE